MKSRASTSSRRRQTPRRRSLAGRAAAGKPSPGWKGAATLFTNARPPSVPASLSLSLEEYYAAGALMGLLASQHDEPDHSWVCEWAFKMGRSMAREAVKRRRKA